MKGVGPALANAFRRILLSEVPTMAIEKVFISNNTSVVPDEVLAHRLGLVPLAVDPRVFDFRGEGDGASESNTLVLRLACKCTRGPEEGSKVDDRVLSEHLVWLPGGSELPDEQPFSRSQEALLPSGCAAVEPDILLAKLAVGQEIELEAHAVKGYGKTHAKWSPVGTAWYELCPELVLLGEPIEGEEAKLFIAQSHPEGWDAQRRRAAGGGVEALCLGQSCFSLEGPKGRLAVANARGCWYCLEKVRRMSGEPQWEGRVQLRRVKEHYLFTVESVGQLPPETLFSEAVAILREKCLRLLSVT
jgi:DNA-directed RNA polymerase I and III subunit RPAC1